MRVRWSRDAFYADWKENAEDRRVVRVVTWRAKVSILGEKNVTQDYFPGRNASCRMSLGMGHAMFQGWARSRLFLVSP